MIPVLILISLFSHSQQTCSGLLCSDSFTLSACKAVSVASFTFSLSGSAFLSSLSNTIKVSSISQTFLKVYNTGAAAACTTICLNSVCGSCSPGVTTFTLPSSGSLVVSMTFPSTTTYSLFDLSAYALTLNLINVGLLSTFTFSGTVTLTAQSSTVANTIAVAMASPGCIIFNLPLACQYVAGQTQIQINGPSLAASPNYSYYAFTDPNPVAGVTATYSAPKLALAGLMTNYEADSYSGKKALFKLCGLSITPQPSYTYTVNLSWNSVFATSYFTVTYNLT